MVKLSAKKVTKQKTYKTGKNDMGLVYADITLINGGDLEMAKRHIIGEEEIKKIEVKMMVDSGAYMMAINESIQAQLELSFIEKRKKLRIVNCFDFQY